MAMFGLEFFCGFFLGVLCIDWRFDALLLWGQGNDGTRNEILRTVFSYYWTVQSGGHVKKVMNIALLATALSVGHRFYVDQSIQAWIVLVALTCGATYFLLVVRPAAEKLGTIKSSMVLADRDKSISERDTKSAVESLEKIRNGHIILLLLVACVMVCL